MKRRLFNLLAAVSLVLCVATVVLCVRAQFRGNDYIELRSKDGNAPPSQPDNWSDWNQQQWTVYLARYEAWDRKRWSLHIRANRDAILAFGRQPFYGYPRNWFDVHFYYWAIIPGLAVLPSLAIARRIVARRIALRVQGLCPTCGYDLRATPDCCPECGTVADARLANPPVA